MLVTLEGFSGSEKATVQETLHDAYPDAVFAREPTLDSWYGKAANHTIDDDGADPLATLFLFTADHADHLSRVVRSALADGKLAVSDRYSNSRYAYQAAALRDNGLRRLMEYIRDVHTAFTRPPDKTIYLGVDPKTVATRGGATDKFEQTAYLADVRENYERLVGAEPERFVRIDATQSPEDVLNAVEAALEAILAEQQPPTDSQFTASSGGSRTLPAAGRRACRW